MVERIADTNGDLIMLFADFTKIRPFPTLTRCWSRMGQQRVLPTPGVRAAKQWDSGAVDPVSGSTVHLIHLRRNSHGFRHLLAAISHAFELPPHPQRRTLLSVDNDKAHQAQSVQRLLAKYPPRIRLEWLRPYSPDFNPQEDVWRHLRRRVPHNYYFVRLDALLEPVRNFHRQKAMC